MQILVPITATSQNMKLYNSNMAAVRHIEDRFLWYISTFYCPINAKFGRKK